MSGEGVRKTAGGAGDSWRVFCAVELPYELRELAASHAAALRAAVPEARASWPRPENLHLTLKFLGEIPRERVESLTRATGLAAVRSHPFNLRIEGAGAFPPRGAPRVIWLGVPDASGALKRLQGDLEEECHREGFVREERPFSPHLTIARIRTPQGARRLAERHTALGFPGAEFTVEEVVVLRSELGPGGSRYTLVSRHSLGPAG